MPAYHSTFLADTDTTKTIGNFALLPFKTHFKGPALPSMAEYDIIDEVVDLFRANTFFRNFEIKGPADRTLIYGILFVSQCLTHLNTRINRHEAVKALTNLSLEDFAIPGDIGFPLNSLYQPPRDRSEATFLRQYLAQFRQELASRLLDRLYSEDDTKPNKFWMAFSRKKFMNKSL